MLAAALAGLLTGAMLGALGSGGAILLVPLLTLGFGLELRHATGTALAVVLASALVGLAVHARQGAVRWREAALVAAPGMAAAAAVAPLHALIPPGVIVALLVTLLVAVAARIWWPLPTVARRRGIVAVLLTGAAAGAVTGLLGVGGGFIVIPALVLVLGVPLPAAVGSSLIVVAANAAAALPGYWLRGDVALSLGLLLALGAAVGVFAGASVARAAGPQRLQHGFAVLLIVVAGVMAVRELVPLG